MAEIIQILNIHRLVNIAVLLTVPSLNEAVVVERVDVLVASPCPLLSCRYVVRHLRGVLRAVDRGRKAHVYILRMFTSCSLDYVAIFPHSSQSMYCARVPASFICSAADRVSILKALSASVSLGPDVDLDAVGKSSKVSSRPACRTLGFFQCSPAIFQRCMYIHACA